MMNSFLYITATSCKEDFARAYQNNDFVLGFMSFFVLLPPFD